MKPSDDMDTFNAGFDAGFDTAKAMGPSTGWTNGEVLLFTLVGVLFGIFLRGWL